MINKHTPTPWMLRPQVLDEYNTGSFGLPTIINRAKVIIPEHFDSEGNDDIDELDIRLEANAAFIVKAVNNHEKLVNTIHDLIELAEATGFGDANAAMIANALLTKIEKSNDR